ncbi:hypothetical protein Syun_008506 [Stephania yunnanensis]|uniref:C3H1-type domain-containing protein n=1 Tax=Stephania yunnanensis TaxID=152371 RepID=A0AAP0KFB2_9MAGN
MSSVCTDHHHHHHHPHYPLFSPQQLSLPPRKLLSRKLHPNKPLTIEAALELEELQECHRDHRDHYQYHQGGTVDDHEDALDGEDVEDPFSSDEFRMYEFKVRRCMRSRSHDWTDCPFAHPGEKARRRDPRKFHYSGNACADFRRTGSCPRGDACEFAHGVFECWLHPARYRTHACKDGKGCKRKVCFFAHSPRELRVLAPNTTTSTTSSDQLMSSTSTLQSRQHKCMYCNNSNSNATVSSSPTSTLMGVHTFSHLSPPMSPTMVSPPQSPTTTTFDGVGYNSLMKRSSISSSSSKCGGVEPELMMSYKSALLELARSLKAMKIEEEELMATQFLMSPCTTSASKKASGNCFSLFSSGDNQDGLMSNNNINGGGPDLEWVNELVM